MVEPDGPQKAI